MTDEPDDEIPIEEQDCPCGSHWPFNECCGTGLDVEELEEAIVFALKRHPATRDLSEIEMWRFAEAVSDAAWPADLPPLCEDPIDIESLIG